MKTKGTILTGEERSVLILEARRLTNEEIAERLGMSVTKVKTLMHQAFLKLGAHTRHDTALLAVVKGEIILDEVYPLDELAEYLAGLGPDILSKMAQVVRQRAEPGILQMKDKEILHTDTKQNTILTRGERDALIFVGHGLTNKEIAERLCLSVSTVRNMLDKACLKLGARHRGDAFMLACKQRAINMGDVFTLDEILRFLAPLGPESLEKMAQLLSQKLEQERIRTDE